MAPDVDNQPALSPYRALAFALFSLSGPCPSLPLDSQPPPPLRVREKAPGRWGQSPGTATRLQCAPGVIARQVPGSGGSGGCQGGIGDVPRGGEEALPSRLSPSGVGGLPAPSCTPCGQSARLPSCCGRRPGIRRPSGQARHAPRPLRAECGPRGDTDSSPACPTPLVPPPRALLYSSGTGNFSALRAPPARTIGSSQRRARRVGARAESRILAGSGGRAGSAREEGSGPAGKPRVCTEAAGRAARGCVTCLPGGRTHFVPGAALPSLGRPSRRGAGGAGAGGRCRVSTFTTPAGRVVTLYFWDRA